ncbi:MAG: serine/threonine protein kinase [Pirellulaceae bacterium]|nr:serine/threonine protein kinase [Pirellulaceae bacterium]
MIAPRCPRDPEQLSRLLQGQLAETVTIDITQHLEQCAECRRQLELIAADGTWWQDARSFLSDDELTPLEPALGQSSDAAGGTGVSSADLVASFLEPSEDKTLIGRLDQYDVLEVIGCGGMGIVLKGHDRQLNRPVAIKVLGPQYATNAAARRRFVREAQAAAAVVHPHVVAIHGVNANSRLPYLVMPYVAGPSLQQRIDELGPLDLRDVLRISFQAAQGLAAAHAQGLVHRDIKPANILLENGVQRVLLTDFGLARAIDDISVTHSGTIAGTPQFMSPEQARGEPLDHRTDLFSLGSVMYTMCAGRPPFRAESTMGVLRRICEETPRDLWLAGIVGKLLAKPRDARFQSADELARLLERCLAHLQHPTAVPLPEGVVALVSQPRRSRARWRRGWAGGSSHGTGPEPGTMRPRQEPSTWCLLPLRRAPRVLCQRQTRGLLGTNEVSPQLRKAGGELKLVPSHPPLTLRLDEARAVSRPAVLMRRFCRGATAWK